MLLIIAWLLGIVQAITVPVGDGDPVMIDGRFAEEEWEDARLIKVGDSVDVYLKQYRGHVFIGVRAPRSMLAYTEVFIETHPGVIQHLHASAQLGERVLADTLWTDQVPAWRWGNSVDWSANVSRFDRLKGDSILQANPQVDRTQMRFLTTYPYDGYEFQIRRSKFPQKEWRVRVEARATIEGQVDRVYPRGSARKQTSTWAVLRF